MRARVETSSWSLVIFTVGAQAAAGAALMRALLPVFLPSRYTHLVLPLVPVGASPEMLAGALDPLGWVALLLLAVAGGFALLHLTRPRAARFAVSHAGTSWLSREILMGALFGGVLVVDLLLGVLGPEAPTLHAVLRWAAAGLGLGFVHAIVRVYRLRTVPAWNARATPIAFFGTTAVLGLAAAAILFALSGQGDDVLAADQSLRTLGLLAAGVVLTQLISVWSHLTKLEHEGGAPAAGARAVLRERRGLLSLRTFCGAFGVLLLLAGTETEAGTQTPAAVWVGCALLLLGELVGRYLFYASHRRVGL